MASSSSSSSSSSTIVPLPLWPLSPALLSELKCSSTYLPNGLSLVLNLITPSEELWLVSGIDQQLWDTTLKRRTQHFGQRYQYRGVASNFDIVPIPKWMDSLIDRMTLFKNAPFCNKRPDQLIINEYQPGQGISSHIDANIFGEPIASLSLLSDYIMTFKRGLETIDLMLPARSLLILQGEARSQWKHEIAARKSDIMPGTSIKSIRSRRISMTFRIMK